MDLPEVKDKLFREFNPSVIPNWHKRYFRSKDTNHRNLVNETKIAVDWCKENCQGRFTYSYGEWDKSMCSFSWAFYFKNKNDAVLFELTWI
jgi:hypothetical protein